MINFLGKLLFLFWQIVLIGAPLRERRDAILSTPAAPPANKKREVFRPITPGYMIIFPIQQAVKKNVLCCYMLMGYSSVRVFFSAPIALRAADVVWVDSRTGQLEVIEREGIVIWRAAWVN